MFIDASDFIRVGTVFSPVPSSFVLVVIAVGYSSPSNPIMGKHKKLEHPMSDSFVIGDRVSWDTSQGRTHGTVEERRTKDFQFDSQKFHASEDEPAFIVKSEKTGATAAHQGSALRKLAAE